MNCPKCGKPVEQGNLTCRCGASLEAWQKSEDSAVTSERQWREALNKTPMKWHKFLMWIIGTKAMFDTCSFGISVIRILNAPSIRKYDYAGYPELWESVVARRDAALQIGLWALIISFVIVLFSIYVRTRLVNYKKNAPKMVTIFYIVYSIAEFVMGNYLIGVSCVVICIVNYVYFKKRKELFIFK